MTIADLPDRSIDRFDPDPTKSFTLAASYYVDPDVFERERPAIFWKNWMFVGHISEVATPGDYLTAEIADQRVFVVRNKAGELRAFHNVCMHRGHSLLEGTGTVNGLITCPYHAWVYDTDGALTGARMSDRMADFDFADFTLPSVGVEVFSSFVFVNLDPDARPMADVYPGLEAALAKLCPELSELSKHDDTIEFDIAANWKNVGDNLLECYHCHPAHKGFVDLIEMDGYLNETHENWSIQSGPSRPENNVYSPEGGAESFTSIFLWPNLSIGRLPGQRGVISFHFEPTAPEATHQKLTYYGPDEELIRSESEAFEFFNNVLGPEDVDLVENVQVGLRSMAYHQGRFICIPDRPEISEHAVHHFHTLVRAALDDD